jgi:hypothetical protein
MLFNYINELIQSCVDSKNRRMFCGELRLY